MEKKRKIKKLAIRHIILSLIFLVSTSIQKKKNPFITSTESGIPISPELQSEYKTLETLSLSLNAKWENLKAKEASNGEIESEMSEKEKCKIWLGRYQREWHQKKKGLENKIWDLEKTHTRKMLSFADFSKHKEIVMGELDSRKKEFEKLKKKAKRKKLKLEKRVEKLRKKLDKLKKEYYIATEKNLEITTKLEVLEKKVTEKKEEIHRVKQVAKVKLSMFFQEEDTTKETIRVMNNKCHKVKKILEERIKKVFNVKGVVKAKLNQFMGKKVKPVKSVKIPAMLKKLLRTKRVIHKRRIKRNSLFSGLKPKKIKHKGSLFNSFKIKKKKELDTEDLFKKTLHKIKKRKKVKNLFKSYLKKKKKEDIMKILNKIKRKRKRIEKKKKSSLFSSFDSKPKRRRHHDSLFNAFKPKKTQKNSLFGGFKKITKHPRRRKSSLFGGFSHKHKKSSLFGAFTKPRNKYKTKQVRSTSSTEEVVPAGQKVTYVVNGKEISQEEFDRLKKKGATVEQNVETKHLAPEERVTTIEEDVDEKGRKKRRRIRHRRKRRKKGRLGLFN